MTLVAKSLITQESDSLSAGRQAGVDLSTAFKDEPIRAVIVYATVNHDQPTLLRALRSEIGDGPIIFGCSVQGVTGYGGVIEQGYAAGFMAIGGAGIQVGSSIVRDIQLEPEKKGLRLAQELLETLPALPKAVVMLWDPLSGVDLQQLVSGFQSEVEAPLVGGAASQPWGPMVQTFQYHNDEVISGSAIALAIAGPIDVQLANSHGATQVGIEMTVTRAEGNKLLELDGQPALDVWSEMVGGSTSNSVDDTAAWAIGVRRQGVGDFEQEWTVMAAFSFEHEEKAVVVQSSIPVGTVVMFHHRSVDAVLEGAAKMGEELRARLAGKNVRAILGFECGARTAPFLGPDATTKENADLQKCIASQAEWLGMLAWGELVPSSNTSIFCNYTYPVMVLSQQ